MGQHSRKVFCASLLALLMSTQTLNGQLHKEKLVYILAFSGEITSTPTAVKVISNTPTTLKVDPRITLDLTAFARSHFPAGEGLNCFGEIPQNLNAKKALVQAWVEIHDAQMPENPSQTFVVINFIGRNTHKTIEIRYELKLRGTRTCTKFPQSSSQTCTIDLIGWRGEGFFVTRGRVGAILPGQGCVSDPNDRRYDPLHLSSQVTLTAR